MPVVAFLILMQSSHNLMNHEKFILSLKAAAIDWESFNDNKTGDHLTFS